MSASVVQTGTITPVSTQNIAHDLEALTAALKQQVQGKYLKLKNETYFKNSMSSFLNPFVSYEQQLHNFQDLKLYELIQNF